MPAQEKPLFSFFAPLLFALIPKERIEEQKQIRSSAFSYRLIVKGLIKSNMPIHGICDKETIKK
ncbi:hypothetical protein HR13_01150 [Porphyromonas gulae]|nr:hypothetical protein HR13_01150 [Porphyromonas gulae]